MRSFMVVISLILASSPAWAQTQPAQTFAALPLRIGDPLQVTDLNGKVIKGTVLDFSPASLLVRSSGSTRDLKVADILEIRQRARDPWWNGALIGVLAGGAIGAGIGAASCPNDPECQAITTPVGLGIGAGIGAAAGAIVDFSFKKMITIYHRPATAQNGSLQFAPILTPNRKGVAFHISF